jgi:hypothetical protein
MPFKATVKQIATAQEHGKGNPGKAYQAVENQQAAADKREETFICVYVD